MVLRLLPYNLQHADMQDFKSTLYTLNLWLAAAFELLFVSVSRFCLQGKYK